MILEIVPSADIHLALTAPYTQVTLGAIQHDATSSSPVAPGQLTFEIDPDANRPTPYQAVNGIVDNGKIRIDVQTGSITALQASESYVRATHQEQVGTTLFSRSVAIRVLVHAAFNGAPWLGNDHASVNAGSDNLVLTTYVENNVGQVVDVSGHGFVTFQLVKRDFGDPPNADPTSQDFVSGAHSGTVSELAVGVPSRYQVGDLLYVPRTMEHMRVTAAQGQSPISVDRGIGSPGVALGDGEEIWLLGGIDAVSGRVRASLASAGSQLKVQARVGTSVLSAPQVRVLPALRQPATEPPHVTRMREAVELLSFRAGPTPPRRNILILAEGYTASQEADFKRHARHIARRMTKRRAHEPFRLLREDYRIWLAFTAAPESGIGVNTRVLDADGTLGLATALAQDLRLMQVPDSWCGMAYGRRAGDVLFSPVPSGTPPTALTDWMAADRESPQLLKDWRRFGSRRGDWQTEALDFFSGLRKKDSTPDDPADTGDSDYRIGETWARGGADQGLVLILVNDHVSAGTYSIGDTGSANGYLFGAITVRDDGAFAIQRDGPRTRHAPVFTVARDSKKTLERVLQAIHELAHGLFLGDEYEDIHAAGLTQAQSFQHDNLDTADWIDQEGATKFSRMPRVEKSSVLLMTATVQTAGELEVLLPPGEGTSWADHAGPVSLQTRNINDSSWAGVLDEYGNLQTIYSRYPAFRAHPYIQATDLTIAAVSANLVTLRGSSLVQGDAFPPGSMLFEPKVHPPGAHGQPMSLVLPGVLTHMNGRTPPLFAKPSGGCAIASSTVTVFHQSTAAALGIVEPRAVHQVVGLYEGGGQMICWVYRPSGECAMGSVASLVDN
jgi:hypothetical protein